MLPALAAAVSLAVQPDTGALTLTLENRPVITGALAQWPLKSAATSVHQDSPSHYTVHVAYTDHSSALYTYALSGNDCTIEYTLTNGADKPMTIELGGWTCAFAPGAALKGTIPHWYWTYYANMGVWHPGVQSPLGAVYAEDDHTAAVFYSPSEFGRRSLINAGWKGDKSLSNPFTLEFHTTSVVAPGASGSASLVMRVTNDLSEQGLHGAYKAFLEAKYPVPLYVPDPRPMGAFTSVDAYYVSPTNPRGYNGDDRRIDRLDGVRRFVKFAADPLQAAHAGGCIFWAPGGTEPIMYPPEFDTNLKRIADTWAALVGAFQSRGLRVGLCARASEMVDRSNPGHLLVSSINPDDRGQVDTLLERFRTVAGMGVNAYYLDTFGHDWASTLVCCLPSARPSGRRCRFIRNIARTPRFPMRIVTANIMAATLWGGIRPSSLRHCSSYFRKASGFA